MCCCVAQLSLRQFPISISTRSGSHGLYLFGDRPDEARQLTRDRGSDYRRLLSCPGELAIPSAQPLLSFPCDVADRLELPLLPQLFSADPCRNSIAPGGFDQHASRATASPSWLSVVLLCTGSQGSVSPPVFPVNGTAPWCPPSFRRVPASPVPRLHEYYEGTTTSCARVPGPLWIRCRVPHAPLCSCSPGTPGAAGAASGPGVFGQPVCPCPAICMWARTGSLRFPGAPSHTSARFSDPGRINRTSPVAVPPMLPPGPTRRRLQHAHDLGAQPRALVSAAYASRAASPPPMQGSLPAGGLRLCREGVEPSGARRKVSDHRHSPFQDFACRKLDPRGATGAQTRHLY